MDHHSNIEEAGECLALLEENFRGRPEGRSGLHLEMKKVAAKLESGTFPVPGLSLDDLSKQHAFIYISPEWAGYFLAVVTYKLLEKCIEGDLSFVDDDVLEDYIFFFMDARLLHDRVIRNLSDRQVRCLSEAIWGFLHFMTPRVLAGNFDLLRDLTCLPDVWQDAIDMK